MELSFGDRRVIKVFRNDKCISIGVPKDELLVHLDSIGVYNIIEKKDLFKDMTDNANNFILHDFDFNEKNGWLNNCLHFDGEKTYISSDIDFNTTDMFSISISFHVPSNGKFVGSFPGVNKMWTENKSLHINVGGMSKIKISNAIKNNTFYNVILVYEVGRLTVYINGENKYSNINITRGYNDKFRIGKDLDDNFGEFMFHSLQYYHKNLSTMEIETISKLEQSRYIVYYDRNMILDCRGYNALLNYGGFISIRDNTPYQNHLRCKDWYVHIHKNRAFGLTGINSMGIVGRQLLLDSFTIEIMFSKVKYMFAERVFLFGKYKENEYGIEVLLDVKGLIIRIHNKGMDVFEYHYKLDYTNKRNHIAISYDHNKKELCLYHNGYIATKLSDIIYKSDINDMTLQFAKTKGYFPYIGNINSIRIYKECVLPECIADNYNKDMEIYRP